MKRKGDLSIIANSASTPSDLHRQIAYLEQELAKTQKLLREEIEISNTDPLSECLNRRGYAKMVEQERTRIASNQSEGGIIIAIDLSHFKRINDIHGHFIGDLAIKAVANTLKSLLRTTDIIARVGGDEFVAILPDTTPLESATKRQEIKQVLKNVTFSPDGAENSTLKKVKVSARCGFARYNKNISIGEAYETADHRERLIGCNLRM